MNARNTYTIFSVLDSTHELFRSTLKLEKYFFFNSKILANVYTFKMKVTTNGKTYENSLSRRTRKVPNLKKIDTLMF